MTTTATEHATLSAWIGCLACYNDGRLVGRWFPATDLDDLTVDDVHAEQGGTRWGCEELEVMDLDGPWPRFVSASRTGLLDVANAARTLTDAAADLDDPTAYDALLIWFNADPSEFPWDGWDRPTEVRFRDSYLGAFEAGLADYADELRDGAVAQLRELARSSARRLGHSPAVADTAVDEVARYFDRDAAVRDLDASGHWQERTTVPIDPSGTFGFHVFVGV